MIHLIHFHNYPGLTSARFFAGKYSVLYFGFLAGAALPIIPWWLHRKYPRRSFDKVGFFDMIRQTPLCDPAKYHDRFPSQLFVMQQACRRWVIFWS